MGRCARIHPFAVVACAVVCVAFGTRASTLNQPANVQTTALVAAEISRVATEAGLRSTPAPVDKRETKKYTLPRDRYEKAIAYSRAGYALYFLRYFSNLLVLILTLRLGLSAKFRDFAEMLTRNRLVQGVVFIPILMLFLEVLDLPFRIDGHALSLRYEQSVQRWGSWIWDWTKGALLEAGFAVIFAMILYAVIRRSPRRWWLYFWIASLPITFVIIFVSPWFIDPLFNKFEPLDAKHPELVSELKKGAHHAGLEIPRERMFLMEASEKTKQLDAYVTGFGASKRVVVWDTTIGKNTIPEMLFIFGHEAGHYKLGHIRDGFLFFAGLLLVALYAGFLGMHWALRHWGGSWRIRGLDDWASFAVFLLLLHVGAFLAMPLANGFSRQQEHAADVYGLELIHGIVPDSNQVAAQAFQVFGEVDLADPDPPKFITLWLYSHPPLADRLAFADSYDPWSKGEPPKYVK
jgi:Zn-dependent protease with chaperone function